MPRFEIRILSPAAEDFEKIAKYHLKMAGPESAERITDKLLDTIEMLAEQPFLGPEHSDELLKKQEYRKLVCNEYFCVYKIINKSIYIYRVVHGATDYPGSL